jgi:hypothetical protein
MESHGGVILTGEPKNLKKNLYLYHIVHCKSQIKRTGYELGPLL